VSDSESRSTDLLAFWLDKGFTEIHIFKGEYTLLIHPRTLDKVRLYENGDVWVSNPKTGEYEKANGKDDRTEQSEVRPVIGDVLQFEDEDNGRLVVTIQLKGTMASRFRQADPAIVQLAFSTPNAAITGISPVDGEVGGANKEVEG